MNLSEGQRRPGRRRPVLMAAGALGLAYVAAVGTMLSIAHNVEPSVRAVAQLLGAVIPLVVGFVAARRLPPRQAAARLGVFAILAGAAGFGAALVFADVLLANPADDALRFAIASVVFIGLLVLLAAFVGAGASWAQQGLDRARPAERVTR